MRSAVMVAVGMRERQGGNRRRENNLENRDAIGLLTRLGRLQTPRTRPPETPGTNRHPPPKGQARERQSVFGVVVGLELEPRVNVRARPLLERLETPFDARETHRENQAAQKRGDGDNDHSGPPELVGQLAEPS